ncbi:hypothetical protein DFH09DRAFT_1378629 [Mycena vulgaris]|nr:hypothetical protein DFH09DRAFT_1378629 [Mycena vulgaris]
MEVVWMLEYLKEFLRVRRREESCATRQHDPSVIRARLAAATIASALGWGIVYYLVDRYTPPSTHAVAPTLAILGIRWPATIVSCLQMPLLFLGPLYKSFLASVLPGQAAYSVNRHFFDVFGTWIGFRNYIWGPLTKEVVCRACVLSVYAMVGAGRGKMIAFAPLVFGLGHVHPAWVFFPAVCYCAPAKEILVFQAAYTTLFGAHASFLFLRTSVLIPPLTAHIFCNIMGVPQLGLETSRHAKTYAGHSALFFGTLLPWTAEWQSLSWDPLADFWRSVVGTD